MAKVKKGMAKEARDNLKIKDEEKLTKRTKTILDKEHAMIEKEKEAEKKWVFLITSKYPLYGYILSVLTHTTAWH